MAEELTAHGAFAAHVDAELNIDPEYLANPWHAAAASAASFIIGALLPLVAVLLPPVAWRVPVTFVAVLVALGLAGALSARIGGSNVPALCCASSSVAPQAWRSPTESGTSSAPHSADAHTVAMRARKPHRSSPSTRSPKIVA